MGVYEEDVIESLEDFEKAVGNALSNYVRGMRNAQYDRSLDSWRNETSISNETKERFNDVLDSLFNRMREVRRWSKSELALRITRTPEEAGP